MLPVRAGEAAAVLAQALEQGADELGGGAAALVAQALVQQAQARAASSLRGPAPPVASRSTSLRSSRSTRSSRSARMVRHLVAHEGGEQHVALHQARLRHAAEDLEDLGADVLRVGRARPGFRSGVAGEFRQQAPDGPRSGSRSAGVLIISRQNGQPERLLGRGRGSSPPSSLRASARSRTSGRAWNTLVTFSSRWRNPGAFQPGNGGAHLRVGHAVLEVDVGFDVLVAQDLAGGDDDLLFVAARRLCAGRAGSGRCRAG